MWQPWRKRLSDVLRSDAVRKGIAAAVSAYAKKHIADSVGRGPNGETVALAALQTVASEYWTTKKPPKGEKASATRQRLMIVKRKKKDGSVELVEQMKTEYKVSGVSYRKGGKPLRDTGNLLRSIGAKAEQTGPARLSIVMSGAIYGIYHEKGFSTSGPNFIPLTRKAKKNHATGANPYTEGLQAGKDYTVRYWGVTVPARPFLVPTSKEFSEIAKTIKIGIALSLKGKLK
jgi:phage gpG-like protein